MIKTTRKKHKISQEELAFYLKVNRSYISKLENANIASNPTLKQIILLSKALKIRPDKLANWFILKYVANTKDEDNVEFGEEFYINIGGNQIERSNVSS